MHRLDIMADVAEVAGQGSSTKSVGIPVFPLVIAVVLAVVVAVGGSGGTLYYLVKSGKLPLAGASQKVEVIGKAQAKTHEIVLEPMLVNLPDEGGRAYLRISMALSVEDPPPPGKDDKPKEEEKPPEKGKVVIEHNAEIRDAALGVIGSETSDTLLAADGKEKLKSKLKAAISERIPGLKIADLFFTEFLVQR